MCSLRVALQPASQTRQPAECKMACVKLVPVLGGCTNRIEGGKPQAILACREKTKDRAARSGPAALHFASRSLNKSIRPRFYYNETTQTTTTGNTAQRQQGARNLYTALNQHANKATGREGGLRVERHARHANKQTLPEHNQRSHPNIEI